MPAVDLQDFSAKYIYEPWKAPIADQKAANCRIGVDYPKPICDHAKVSKENVEKLKQAYANQPQHSKSPIKAKTAGQTHEAAGQPQSGAGHSQAGTGHFHARTSQPSGAAQQPAREAGQAASSTGRAEAAMRSAGDSSSQNTTDANQIAAAEPAGKCSKQSTCDQASQEAHPASGFDDVAMPKDPQEAGNHETDAAEPEASMPGGCASGKSSKPLAPEDNSAAPGPKGSEVPEALAKQKKLDWTAVAAYGEKRKRGSGAEVSPQLKRRSSRQKKLSFAGKA